MERAAAGARAQHGWSDCGGEVERRFSKDELTTSVMLYWLTGTIGSSARYYYEARAKSWTPSHPGPRMVKAPTEHDVCHWPRAAMERGFNRRAGPAPQPAAISHRWKNPNWWWRNCGNFSGRCQAPD